MSSCCYYEGGQLSMYYGGAGSGTENLRESLIQMLAEFGKTPVE